VRKGAWVAAARGSRSGENDAMPLKEAKVDRVRLAELCDQYGVARLEVFGSCARGDAGADAGGRQECLPHQADN